MAGVIQVGQHFSLEGHASRIMRAIGTSEWFVENLSNGRIWETTTDELLAKWQAGELQFPGGAGNAIPSAAEQTAFKAAAVDAFMQSYPAPIIERAKAKLAFVKRLKDLPMTACTITPLIQEIWSNKALWKGQCLFAKVPHFTTVAKWVCAYRNAGDDIRALADRHHNKGNGNARYSNEVSDLADDIINTLYLTLERRSIADCLETLRGRVAKLNQARLPSEQLARPRYKYLKRKIKALPAYDVCVARYGKRIADIRFRAAGNGVFAETPLARAAIDHCRLDLIVVDDETGLPLGRPWLTLVLDEYSRYALGYYIGFEDPSSVSIARALRNAIMPKADLLKRHPKIISSWDAWGTVHTLVADNGVEFHGTAVEMAMDAFGMVVQFCPRRKPWYKGKIERFFGTLNTGLLAGIPGRTFLNVLEKADYEPLKHAVVGLATLREVVLTWVVDVYHQAPHRALGRPPGEAWAEAISRTDRWLPSSSAVFDSAFSRRDVRVLSHKGIEFDGLLYNSDDMRLLREQHGMTLKVEIRVMDEDLGYLFVVAPDGRTVIKVPALDQAYAQGMTRWQHKVCRRYQRRMLDDEQRDISLTGAKERIRQLIRDDAKRGKRTTRKKQSRFTEEADGTVQLAAFASPPATSAPDPAAVAQQTGVDIHAESAPYSHTPPEQDTVPMLASRRVSTPLEVCA
ncbi:DDE-type integrase/transposase/recombinase [Thermomonas brevis]|uniref:DDE-type integrase/transposase/recombinase n=1 Tax=Thermomonas brevis TaxID=215691 RepID=A0A7G9QQ44_9GAMM|nr:Mu transposase C-terminal domain-containing protein [Thermomonas brevis]QNN45469.1 DDE-type integrase/transposase/recombinase [Thermomonas brevis]